MANKDYKEFVKAVKPYYISLYLEKCGWNLVRLKNRKPFDIYQIKKDGFLQQINVPSNSKLADYEDMIFLACSKLSQYEQISMNDLFFRITNPQADVIKVRTSNDSVSNGSILFDEAVGLIENSKRLIIDAAMDITSKSKYRTGGRFGKEIEDFISKCRFGQTEVGSYVISIICPFDNINSQNQEQLNLFGTDCEDNDNFTRKVVRKVFKSIDALSHSIDDKTDLSEYLEKEDDDFISLNFMEDLSNLVQSGDNSFIELSTELDPTSKLDEENYKAIFPSYKKAALSNFVVTKKNSEENDTEITVYGYISKTTAEPILTQRVEGEVTIREESSNANYKVVLDKEQYDEALAAHKNGQLVKIIGRKNGDRIIHPIFTVPTQR